MSSFPLFLLKKHQQQNPCFILWNYPSALLSYPISLIFMESSEPTIGNQHLALHLRNENTFQTSLIRKGLNLRGCYQGTALTLFTAIGAFTKLPEPVVDMRNERWQRMQSTHGERDMGKRQTPGPTGLVSSYRQTQIWYSGIVSVLVKLHVTILLMFGKVKPGLPLVITKRIFTLHILFLLYSFLNSFDTR